MRMTGMDMIVLFLIFVCWTSGIYFMLRKVFFEIIPKIKNHHEDSK